MAVFTPGALISEIRGSVGSQNFSRNASGPIVRAKLTQPVSGTSLQLANRSRMENAVAAWQALSHEQRNAWMLSAKKYPYNDRLGKTRFYSGYIFFISCYLNIENAFGSVPFIQPPRRYPLGNVLTGFTTFSGQIVITKRVHEYQDDVTAVIQMTEALPSSINSLNPALYYNVTTQVVSDSSRINFENPWVSYFSASFPASSALSIWVRVKSVDLLSGLASPWSYIRYIP